MDFNDVKDLRQMIPADPQYAEGKMRIIQELVPGKQITIPATMPPLSFCL